MSLRCPRSSPKGVWAQYCLPLSLHLCGPRLQRPTVNGQESEVSQRDETNTQRTEYTERHGTSGQQTHVRAALCLHYTTFKAGWYILFYCHCLRDSNVSLNVKINVSSTNCLLKGKSYPKTAVDTKSCERRRLCQVVICLPDSVAQVTKVWENVRSNGP